jgi:hypothetical protein
MYRCLSLEPRLHCMSLCRRMNQWWPPQQSPWQLTPCLKVGNRRAIITWWHPGHFWRHMGVRGGGDVSSSITLLLGISQARRLVAATAATFRRALPGARANQNINAAISSSAPRALVPAARACFHCMTYALSFAHAVPSTPARPLETAGHDARPSSCICKGWHQHVRRPSAVRACLLVVYTRSRPSGQVDTLSMPWQEGWLRRPASRVVILSHFTGAGAYVTVELGAHRHAVGFSSRRCVLLPVRTSASHNLRREENLGRPWLMQQSWWDSKPVNTTLIWTERSAWMTLLAAPSCWERHLQRVPRCKPESPSY